MLTALQRIQKAKTTIEIVKIMTQAAHEAGYAMDDDLTYIELCELAADTHPELAEVLREADTKWHEVDY